MGYSLETKYEIWNDDTGERLEVGPDRDGLDLIEIRSITDDGTIGSRISIVKKQIPLLIEALRKVIE